METYLQRGLALLLLVGGTFLFLMLIMLFMSAGMSDRSYDECCAQFRDAR